MLQAHKVFRAFNGHAEPDVRRRQTGAVTAAKISDKERAAFGQDLIGMPVGRLHGVEHGVDESFGHLLVKEVAHGVDEDAPRLSPLERLGHALRPEREVEAVLKRMPGDAAKPLREALGITKIAAARDF